MSIMSRIFLIVAMGLFLPLVQVGIFLYRFEAMETNQWIQTLAFAPAGLLSAWYLTLLIPRTVHSTHKTLLFVGWFVSMPFALAGSLIGGLVLSIWIGPSLFGIIPLLVGVWLFNRIGKNMIDPALRQ